MNRTNSSDRNRESSCEGKVAMHVDEAKRAAKRMGLAPYKCNHCKHWHIGTANVKFVDKRTKFNILSDVWKGE